MSPQSSTSLKSILLLDAATCLLMGALLIAASGFVASLTAIPDALLFYAGLLLIPIGLFMASTARWWPANGGAVWLIILGNAGWVVASLALLAVITPNALGTAFIAAQALVVAALATLEYRTLRAASAALA